MEEKKRKRLWGFYTFGESFSVVFPFEKLFACKVSSMVRKLNFFCVTEKKTSDSRNFFVFQMSASPVSAAVPGPNCSVCVDKHLASQHCATCDDVMCEEAVGVHRELVKC